MQVSQCNFIGFAKFRIIILSLDIYFSEMKGDKKHGYRKCESDKICIIYCC